jgi:transposase-like protein
MAKLACKRTTVEEFGHLELLDNFGKQFWDDVSDQVAGAIKNLIERCLEAKRTEAVGAASYERTKRRTARRGGSYRRRVRTKWGEIERRVPRIADGSYDLEIIDRYGRRQVEVDRAIGQLWLAGISTRRLNNITEDIFGYGVRRSTVSRITRGLEAEVAAFRSKPIPDTARYLLLDGIHAKVREVATAGKVSWSPTASTSMAVGRSLGSCSPIRSRPRRGAPSSPTSRPGGSGAAVCGS